MLLTVEEQPYLGPHTGVPASSMPLLPIYECDEVVDELAPELDLFLLPFRSGRLLSRTGVFDGLTLRTQTTTEHHTRTLWR